MKSGRFVWVVEMFDGKYWVVWEMRESFEWAKTCLNHIRKMGNYPKTRFRIKKYSPVR
jgi:hypothetical protein